MKFQLSVIIVNFNGLRFLDDCFESLHQNLSEITYEIIVLDNQSTDQSVAYIQQNHPEITLIQSSENLGFGKGNNKAVESAQGEFLLLINNDTVVLNPLKPALEVLQSNPTIGVVGAKMLDVNKNYIPSNGNFPTARTLFQFKKLLDLGPEFKTGNFTKKQYNVDWLCGSFLMLKTQTFRQINGFDEDYFMYVEDVDFCKKIANRNLKRVFLPQISYIHYIGFNANKNPMLVKGYKIYVQKHFLGFKKFVVFAALYVNSIVKNTKLALQTN